MNWISVKDKLPISPSRQVLTYSITGKGEHFGCYVLYYYQGEWWRSMDGLWAFEVTHWTPLPEPPQEQE